MTLTIDKTSRRNGRRKSMARRPRGHEKINMDKKRFGYFPKRFTWRGRRYDVHAVERCWTVSRKRLGNKVERLCFRVRCAAINGRGGRSGRGRVGGHVRPVPRVGHKHVATGKGHLAGQLKNG